MRTEARLALMAISGKFPNSETILRDEIRRYSDANEILSNAIASYSATIDELRLENARLYKNQVPLC